MTKIEFMEKFNDWEKRSEAILRHYSFIERLTARFDLHTSCTDCEAIMPTAREHVYCSKCGSFNTVSPYYC